MSMELSCDAQFITPTLSHRLTSIRFTYLKCHEVQHHEKMFGQSQ